MKINKQILRNIILETIEEADLGLGKKRSADVAGDTTQLKRDMVQGGIDDNERAVIQTVSSKLAAAAKKGNLLSGPVKMQIQRLLPILNKIVGDEGGE